MYTQYFHIGPSVSSVSVCLAGTCAYFPISAPTGSLFQLGYGHRVTVTLLASDSPPTRLGAYSNTSGEFAIDMNPPVVNVPASHDFPLTDTYIEFEFQPTTGFDFNIRVDYELAPGESAGSFCAYGTRIQPGNQNTEVITEAIIALAVEGLAPEFFWVPTILAGLIGLSWVPGNVCSGPPPSIPHFDATDFFLGTDIPLPATLPKLFTLFEALQWPRLCECLPASGSDPPAIPFPPPRDGLPPANAPGPAAPITCDGADLCTSLDFIMRQLRTVTAQLAALTTEVTLIQRQGVPFGFVPGATHMSLSGDGHFAVTDLIGLKVDYTTLPSGATNLHGDPLSYRGLGKVTLGASGGSERSWWPTHPSFLIFPVSAAFTAVAYSIPLGGVVTITELVREP